MKKKTKVKDKTDTHELSLLPAKALIAVKSLLDYSIDDNSRRCLERVFKEYKTNKDEVKNSLILAFRYFRSTRKDNVVKLVKEEINRIAKDVWR